jgi:hypothetical protein
MNGMDLSGLADKGFVRFSIRAEDTEENKAVHAAFKDFCRAECDNNYTIGLRTLLNYYAGDYKFEAIWDKIALVEARVIDIEKNVSKKNDADGGVF